MTERTVTVRIPRDASRLGEAATVADLDRYAVNLKDVLEKEFDCNIHVRWASTSGYTTSDDSEVQARIREIESTDQWITLL